MAQMPGLSGGLPLVYIVYSRKKYVAYASAPRPTVLFVSLSRSREKEYLYEMRLAQDRRGQDALAWQGGSAAETPRGASRPRPYCISTDPLSWGPVCAHSL